MKFIHVYATPDGESHWEPLPIEFLDGKVIDGRRRVLACEKAGVKPVCRTIKTDDPTDPLHLIWRYDSQNPTNNPGKYDLWVEWRQKDKVEVIGNFKR